MGHGEDGLECRHVRHTVCCCNGGMGVAGMVIGREIRGGAHGGGVKWIWDTEGWYYRQEV